MSRFGLVGRRLRNLRRRASLAYELGREPVRIDDLVSPLRYDILVREQFLKSLIENSAGTGAGDLSALVENSREDPYFVWYREIAVPPFHPNLVGREDAIRQAFAERVRTAIELYGNLTTDGYDRGWPIMLLTGRTIMPTATGKQVACHLYAGDGCHRLALLRLLGVSVLEPGSYRVQIAGRFAPLDNTAPLIPLLDIEPRTYFTFLALSYAPGAVCETKAELLLQTGALNPGRLDELTNLLAIDTPLLSSA